MPAKPVAREWTDEDNDRVARRVRGWTAAALMGTASAALMAGVAWWIALPLAAVTALYTWRFVDRIEGRDDPFTWHAARNTLPRGAREAVHAFAAEMIPLGFVPRGVAYGKDGFDEAWAWVADHPERDQTALLVAERPMTTPVCEEFHVTRSITTWLDDGRRFCTGWSVNPQADVGRPSEMVNFPSLRCAAELYAMHQVRTAAVRDRVVEPRPKPAAERMRIRDEMNLDYETRAGWTWHDGTFLRNTAKAAAWYAFTLIPPGSWLLALHRRSRERRIRAVAAAID